MDFTMVAASLLGFGVVFGLLYYFIIYKPEKEYEESKAKYDKALELQRQQAAVVPPQLYAPTSAARRPVSVNRLAEKVYPKAAPVSTPGPSRRKSADDDDLSSAALGFALGSMLSSGGDSSPSMPSFSDVSSGSSSTDSSFSSGGGDFGGAGATDSW